MTTAASNWGPRHDSDPEPATQHTRDDGEPQGHQRREKADVVIENFRPDVKARLGIDYGNLRSINPRLV